MSIRNNPPSLTFHPPSPSTPSPSTPSPSTSSPSTFSPSTSHPSPPHPPPTQALGIIAGVLLHDHEVRKTEFHQLPYHRIIIMLFIELNAPEAILDTLNYDIIQTFWCLLGGFSCDGGDWLMGFWFCLFCIFGDFFRFFFFNFLFFFFREFFRFFYFL